MNLLNQAEMKELYGGGWLDAAAGVCVGFSVATGVAAFTGSVATGVGPIVIGSIAIACAGLAVYQHLG